MIDRQLQAERERAKEAEEQEGTEEEHPTTNNVSQTNEKQFGAQGRTQEGAQGG